MLKTAALPHLLEALSANARYFESDIALFEIGKIYVPRRGHLPDERTVLTAVIGPQLSLPAWQGVRPTSFFDARAAAEQVLDRFHLSGEFAPCEHPVFAARSGGRGTGRGQPDRRGGAAEPAGSWSASPSTGRPTRCY